MSDHLILSDLSEPQLLRLAQEVGFMLRRGDVIALRGDLGAGKTTFARALIRAIAQDNTLDIPSPTFTLVQNYDIAKLNLAHFDLYRLASADEFDELGLDHALAEGAAIIEWPDRAGEALPEDRLDIFLSDGALLDGVDTRSVRLEGRRSWGPRAARLAALHGIVRKAGYTGDGISLTAMTGDASVRYYGRLTRGRHPSGDAAASHSSGEAPALVMDWPHQPDGPAIRDNLPYSRIAHLAEGVTPFVGIAQALQAAGFSAPEIHAADLDNGLLVLEDFGERDFARALSSGSSQEELWRAATDVLVELRSLPIPPAVPCGAQEVHILPAFDEGVLEVETDLLIDWYWPAIHGEPAPPSRREAFREAWAPLVSQLARQTPQWVLRDFHSPNLLWLPKREGVQRIGVIDFQDALAGPAAYDLVSLLQDARIDVEADLEARLLDHYIARVKAKEPGFDEASFRFTYAALGAQRNSKILGIFTRLAHRDGKLGYLAHVPRVWSYLSRDLAHSRLSSLAQWYDHAFPPNIRHLVPAA